MVVGSRMYMFGGTSGDNEVKYHGDMFVLHCELANLLLLLTIDHI